MNLAGLLFNFPKKHIRTGFFQCLLALHENDVHVLFICIIEYYDTQKYNDLKINSDSKLMRNC